MPKNKPYDVRHRIDKVFAAEDANRRRSRLSPAVLKQLRKCLVITEAKAQADLAAHLIAHPLQGNRLASLVATSDEVTKELPDIVREELETAHRRATVAAHDLKRAYHYLHESLPLDLKSEGVDWQDLSERSRETLASTLVDWLTYDPTAKKDFLANDPVVAAYLKAAMESLPGLKEIVCRNPLIEVIFELPPERTLVLASPIR